MKSFGSPFTGEIQTCGIPVVDLTVAFCKECIQLRFAPMNLPKSEYGNPMERLRYAWSESIIAGTQLQLHHLKLSNQLSLSIHPI